MPKISRYKNSLVVHPLSKLMFSLQLKIQEGSQVYELSFIPSIVDGNILVPDLYQYMDIFADKNQNCALRYRDFEFLITSRLTIRRRLTLDDEAKFFLSMYGVDFLEIPSTNDMEPFELIYQTELTQHPELVVPLNKIPSDCLKHARIFLHITKMNFYGEEKIFKRVKASEWLGIIKEQGFRNVYLICTKGQLIKVDMEESSADKIIEENTGKQFNPETFMKFKLLSDQILPKNSYPEVLVEGLKASFSHPLTEIGLRSLKFLSKEIVDRYNSWLTADTEFIAPIVSLCQSSGSGKSKLAVELLKRNPGYYLVFRDSDQSGYPFTNLLSAELTGIINLYKDSVLYQNSTDYRISTVGKILNFFAKLLTTYLQHFFKEMKLKASNYMDFDGSKELEIFFAETIGYLGKKFERNDEISLSDIISEDQMNILYQKIIGHDSTNVSVEKVATYIKLVLEDPKLILFDDFSNDLEIKACEGLKLHLTKFPFLFVLDEADLLKNIRNVQINSENEPSNLSINGFEILRRALSFLDVGTRVMFLTLGTKSTIIDLNPPPLDLSHRFNRRKLLPRPIIFNSNCSIFSREYPLTDIVPTHSLLTNPLMFKLLTSIGHGIWSSYQFDIVVKKAADKLLNGSGSTFSYFIPVWMILTGLSADPLSLNTRTLVANHMGTLIDLSKDLQNMLVAYPSEPILALAALKLIKGYTNTRDIVDDDQLFQTLKSKAEAIVADKGELSEAFAAMFILIALSKCPNVSRTCNSESTYSNLVAEIKTATSGNGNELNRLWDTKSFLLEDESPDATICDAPIRACIEFPDYRVHTVADFLKVWSDTSNIDSHNLSEMSPSVLGGIVNATHFVRLSKAANGFKISNGCRLDPKSLPQADNRIKDKSRNVIDESILKLGLLRQCGFFLPPGSFGIDMIIPVCMKEGGYTFIGVQVKRSGANLTSDIYKMQARLHLVKCVECEKFQERKGCKKCLNNNTLKTIYGNQISLLISLDELDELTSKRYRPEYKFYANCSEEDETLIEEYFQNPSGSLKLKMKNQDFLEPLINMKLAIKPNILLSKTLWLDRVSHIPDGLKDDKMCHRQFCVVTRGLEIAKRFFSDQTAAIIYDILRSYGIFKNRGIYIDSRLMRTVLYDTSPSYFEYCDYLGQMRFERNELDVVDMEFGLIESDDD